ncbi:MAG: energy transducer TonB [Desulfotignum sp.]
MATHSTSSVNWVLHGFILVSIGIHAVVFLHIAGIYENRAVSYIELTLQQVSNPATRNIPQPRTRNKPEPTAEITPVTPQQLHIPKIKLDPVVARTPDLRYDTVQLPQMPDTVSAAQASAAAVDSRPASVDTADVPVEFTTAREYLDLLNMRINSVKQYPESARSRHIQGQVQVSFVLMADGSLGDVRIVKSSRHSNLDDAAIAAIKKAAPFPKPPPSLFNAPVTLHINILFELA